MEAAIPNKATITLDEATLRPLLLSRYLIPDQEDTDRFSAISAKEYLSLYPRSCMSPHPIFRAEKWESIVETAHYNTNSQAIMAFLNLAENEPCAFFYVFDSKFYAQTYLKESNKEIPAVLHYLSEGVYLDHSPNPFVVGSAFFLDVINSTSSWSSTNFLEDFFAALSKASTKLIYRGFDPDFERRHDLGGVPEWVCIDRYLNSDRYKQFYEFSSFLDASLDFEPKVYSTLHEDLGGLTAQELQSHFEEHGRSEGRIASFGEIIRESSAVFNSLPENFNWKAYREHNPDLYQFDAELPCLLHYISFGHAENRPLNRPLFYYTPEKVRNYLPYESGRARQAGAGGKKLYVLFHVYYLEEIETYLDQLKWLYQCGAEVFVNIVAQRPAFNYLEQLASIEARVSISPNTGRDIGGFSRLLEQIDFQEEDVFVLLHTKRSPHVTAEFRYSWIDDLLHGVGSTKNHIIQNLNLMIKDPDVMMIGALSRYFCDGGGDRNRDAILRLLKRMGLNDDCASYPFLSGTMGWFRGKIFRDVGSVISTEEFEEGRISDLEYNIDGQLAHSVERLFGIVACVNGRIVWR